MGSFNAKATYSTFRKSLDIALRSGEGGKDRKDSQVIGLHFGALQCRTGKVILGEIDRLAIED
jgi:hypothetical protein